MLFRSACEAQRLVVNGRIARASYEVKLGDIIEINFGRRILKLEVLAITEVLSKADAPAMYKELI